MILTDKVHDAAAHTAGACAVLVCALVAACSGGTDLPKTLGSSAMAGAGGTTGGTGNTGGRAGNSRGGGEADSGTVAGAPVVAVTSPISLGSPGAGAVLTDDTVTVVCTARPSSMPGATAVDSSTVRIAVLDATDQVMTELPGKPSSNANEYQAPFVVSTVPNGVISFQCKASDTSSPAKTGSDRISTFVDHGPSVTVSTPAPDSAYPQTGTVPFAFTVTPAPLAPGDPDADVTSVSLTVNGRSIPVVRDPADPLGYKLAVDFNDTNIFPQPPNGMVPVEIKARDARKPKAAERVDSYHFALDGTGPVVTLTKPKNQDIIGGKVTMEFSVVDALSGVDLKTVSVELNQVAKFYSPTDSNWTVNKEKFTYTFDSTNVAGSKVQATVNITAADVAGNHSAGESVVLYLDNQPPTVDLDPANVRQLRSVGSSLLCSESFDPLGLAANDLALVKPFTTFRALVWDETNFIAGQRVQYIAAVDQSSVYLYLQPDGPTVPLLIDTDGDGKCDALDASPGGIPLPSLRLNPVAPQGNAFFPANADAAAEPQITVGADCNLGTEPTPPVRLCMNASDLTQVIRHNAAQVEPVVYGIGGLTGLECTGTGWELPAQLMHATQKEGWFCLAAVATDKVGNSAISPPLRVCFDDPETVDVHPRCAMMSEEAPTCTKGCSVPPHFGPQVLAAH